jgi:hypothetical protein
LKYRYKPMPTAVTNAPEATATLFVKVVSGSLLGGVASGEGVGDSPGVGVGLAVGLGVGVAGGLVGDICGGNKTVGSHVSNERSAHVGN